MQKMNHTKMKYLLLLGQILFFILLTSSLQYDSEKFTGNYFDLIVFKSEEAVVSLHGQGVLLLTNTVCPSYRQPFLHVSLLLITTAYLLGLNNCIGCDRLS